MLIDSDVESDEDIKSSNTGESVNPNEVRLT